MYQEVGENGKKPIGLYIHVPFCHLKCNYCDFYTLKNSPSIKRNFVDGLISHLKMWSYHVDFDIDTIYFGGGTPTTLDIKDFQRIFKFLYKYFNVTKDCEISVESNPENLSDIYCKGLKEVGVNRVSIGVQSLDNDILKYLGRSHRQDDVKKAVYNCKANGLYNISLDFITGTSFDSVDITYKNIDFCSKNDIKHISNYLLKIEKGTYFYKNKEYKKMPSDDIVAKGYEDIVCLLEDNGFLQYEISNFSKKGYESKHNLKYWTCQEYLGIGPSAHSLLNKKRFFYENAINKFNKSNNYNKNIIFDENFEKKDFIIMGLRLKKGISLDYLFRLVDYDRDILLKKLNQMETDGLMEIKKGVIKLTLKGFLVSNSIINWILA
ncbi:MAG: radical SAM family heme chaperone HemW [Oscillospiraceae bacterium]